MTNEELCVRAQAGDLESRNELILRNLDFIRKRAWEYLQLYESWCIDIEDIVHEGCLGYILAIEKYDAEHGERFLTYAYDWVTKYMKRFCDETARERQNAELSENDGDDDPEEVDPEQPAITGNYPNRKIESDLIRDENDLLLYRALNELTDRQKEYVIYRFGFDEENQEHSIIETAEYFHLRETRAKKLEREILKSLRDRVIQKNEKTYVTEKPETQKIRIPWPPPQMETCENALVRSGGYEDFYIPPAARSEHNQFAGIAH